VVDLAVEPLNLVRVARGLREYYSKNDDKNKNNEE